MRFILKRKPISRDHQRPILLSSCVDPCQHNLQLFCPQSDGIAEAVGCSSAERKNLDSKCDVSKFWRKKLRPALLCMRSFAWTASYIWSVLSTTVGTLYGISEWEDFGPRESGRKTFVSGALNRELWWSNFYRLIVTPEVPDDQRPIWLASPATPSDRPYFIHF